MAVDTSGNKSSVEAEQEVGLGDRAGAVASAGEVTDRTAEKRVGDVQTRPEPQAKKNRVSTGPGNMPTQFLKSSKKDRRAAFLNHPTNRSKRQQTIMSMLPTENKKKKQEKKIKRKAPKMDDPKPDVSIPDKLVKKFQEVAEKQTIETIAVIAGKYDKNSDSFVASDLLFPPQKNNTDPTVKFQIMESLATILRLKRGYKSLELSIPTWQNTAELHHQ